MLSWKISPRFPMGDGFQFRFQDVSAPLHNNRIAHVYKNSRS